MVIEIVLAIIIFSLVPLAVKETTANPFTIGIFRLLIATVLLGLFWRKKINWRVYKEATFWKLIIIGLCFFGHWITYTFSVKVVGPSVCVLGLATYGIQLIFYGAIFLGYKVSKKNILCLVLSLIGVGLVVPTWDFQNNTTLGLTLALISASFYSIIPIMLQKSNEFNQETRIFYQFSISSIGYIFLFGQTSWSGLSSNDWWMLIFLAVFGTFIAHTFWSKAVTNLPTTSSGIIYYLVTPLTMILSWGILGEVLTGLQRLGGVVILMAALVNILTRDRVKFLYRKIARNS